MSGVFEALFQGDYESHNPVAQELDHTMKNLQLKDELDGLDDFYAEAMRELKLATTREARQNFIRKLYENFYKSLDPNKQAKHVVNESKDERMREVGWLWPMSGRHTLKTRCRSLPGNENK